ncbi:fasciculation and elongation protein zeta-2-like [Actinia tenebrosa]|uniref:Fasciculation and elongation protein zeta-2-like n=1 Tax=Actinia tenebrosa TaxID=6105 RepID=A0A6P8HSP3_ACTTE|nr:fasciculation and elongation protein zeta-2-like [Actinia tenebrosa]
MAAGESFVQTANGEEDPGEEDDDWSDFTSDVNTASTSTNFDEHSDKKSLPSKNNTQAFDSASETTKLCFPLASSSSSDLLNGETSKNDLEEKPSLLEEHLPYSSYFPQPAWKGSCFESALIKSLNILSPIKGEDQGCNIDIERIPGLFNFHQLSERSMDFLRSSPRWDLGQRIDNSSGMMPARSRESGLDESSDNNLNEFTGDLEIWTDSDGADADEFFLLFGKEQTEETRSLEDGHPAAGLHQLAYEELQDLRDEMATYVKEYSDVLVEELIVKDEQLREKELKNSFISSLLTLQSKLRDVQSSQGKKKNVPSANIYLTTVIPYEEKMGGPNKQSLEKLIEIMDAMKCDSPTVPNLLTEYILKVLCP